MIYDDFVGVQTQKDTHTAFLLLLKKNSSTMPIFARYHAPPLPIKLLFEFELSAGDI